MAATKAPAVSGRVAALLGARPHTAAAAVASARAFTTLSPSAIESHNVGVLAMDAYIPPEFVAQSDLERACQARPSMHTRTTPAWMLTACVRCRVLRRRRGQVHRRTWPGTFPATPRCSCQAHLAAPAARALMN